MFVGDRGWLFRVLTVVVVVDYVDGTHVSTRVDTFPPHILQGADGKTDWDAVIDAEMERRRLLENSPIPSTNDDPVVFDTSEIPWCVLGVCECVFIVCLLGVRVQTCVAVLSGCSDDDDDNSQYAA